MMAQKWRDKRDVAVLSTCHRDQMVSIQSSRGQKMKPKAILIERLLEDDEENHDHCQNVGGTLYIGDPLTPNSGGGDVSPPSPPRFTPLVQRTSYNDITAIDLLIAVSTVRRRLTSHINNETECAQVNDGLDF